MTANEIHYETLFELLPQAVVVVDQGLTVRSANRAAAALLATPGTRIAGAQLSELIAHRDFPRLVLRPGESVRIIELHPEAGADGLRLGKILRITVVRPSGADWLLLVLEDVSEKVLLENQLVEAERLAGMGQLAESIVHELGNPLSAMVANLECLREHLSGNSGAAWLEPVDSSLEILEQMHRLLRGLSEFTGQRRPQYEMADVTRLIRRNLVFIAQEAEVRRVRIQTRLPEALPLCHLDPQAVGQVLRNLFKNALEALPEGGLLTVAARTGEMRCDGSAAAVIDIEDNGVGIHDADLRKVFRPLFTTKPGGTGLGLSFCRHVVEEHGGEIALSSRPGLGTTVTVRFPFPSETGIPAC